ncbi:MAG: hypothetical protein IH629_03210, partial [Thermoleophilia bacterium]|nr:hypothetical protein [Thermoleophilia bacterium]
YITADTCRACHPGNHASWHASYHRTMTQVAKPANLADDIDGLEVNYDDLDYRVDRKGDAFFVRTKPTAAPASAFGSPQEVVLTTGSHNLQILWLAAGEGRDWASLDLPAQEKYYQRAKAEQAGAKASPGGDADTAPGTGDESPDAGA